MRRIRRQPAPRREDRLPNGAATFDDLIGRDAWEFEWRLLGVDTLYETVRFPVTRQTAVLTDTEGNYIDIHAADVKLMGPDYPLYTEDGGVPCYVLESIPKKDWHANYYMSKLIYWVDQQSFFPLRIEEYDRDGKLAFINARTGIRANPKLGDRGYDEFYLRPSLERDKFPQQRPIQLGADMEARIAAQEREGRIVFESSLLAGYEPRALEE